MPARPASTITPSRENKSRFSICILLDQNFAAQFKIRKSRRQFKTAKDPGSIESLNVQDSFLIKGAFALPKDDVDEACETVYFQLVTFFRWVADEKQDHGR
ncbi:MAG: hypothetical protein LAN71_11760 [Acidobacteriia bacterium]|nr:hypothetical protein [Terriglobia bacterium]